MRLLKLLLLLCVCAAGPAAAGPFEDAVAASQGDYATAMRLWRPLADQGDAGAQLNLGLMYDNGRGVPQDYAAAVKWYRKAADRAMPPPRTTSASCTTRPGVPQDYAAGGVKWYRKAADAGRCRRPDNLGVMYDQARACRRTTLRR